MTDAKLYTQPVLMGDLVRSESAPDRARLHRLFNVAIEQANVEHRADIVSPLTINLGDEFQGLCRSLSASLTIAQSLRWRLLEQQVECRFVLGLAALSTPVNPVRAWNMMGEGLAQTREKLEQKKEPAAYRFSLPSRPTTERLLDAIGLALTDVEGEWTDRQREIALGSLRDPGGSVGLAKRFKVRETVFYKIRRAAKYDLYQTLVASVADVLAGIDQEITS